MIKQNVKEISRTVGKVSQDEDGLMICSYCRIFPDFANKSGALSKGTKEHLL